MSKSGGAEHDLELIDEINRLCDSEFVLETLVRLVKTPSDVPNGKISIQPDDPKIGHYVQDVIRPLLSNLVPGEVRSDDLNDLIVTVGTAETSAPKLMLTGYTVSQHANLMEEPYSGRVSSAEFAGIDNPCVFGKGSSQNKGALAAVFGALKILQDSGRKSQDCAILAINSEGESSHRCMRSIISMLEVHPEGGILCVGTGNRISLGNRGRVDIYVTVHGKSAHSSQPWLGKNAIIGLRSVLENLDRLKFKDKREDLGSSQLTPYNLACSPSSPHTIPDECRVILDRRILPGEAIDEAVNSIRTLLEDVAEFQIDVEQGAFMFPSEVKPNNHVVLTIRSALSCFGVGEPHLFFPDYTFDAGYPTHEGIPTVMFGPSSWADSELGEDIIGTEFVEISRVITATKVYAYVLMSLLGY